MAYYNYKCSECGLDFVINKAMDDSDQQERCPDCSEMGIRIFIPTVVHGLSDGPGTMTPNKPHRPIFDKPDPHNDIRFTYNKLREAGKLDKDSGMKADIELKMATLKDRPREKLDYQKVGHPCER